MRKNYFNFILIFISCLTSYSQDAQFFIPNISLISLNPSFAGNKGCVRSQSAYRNQWPNLSGTYVTYYSAVDLYIKSLKGGLSYSILTDDQAKGTLKTTYFSMGYAQHILLMNGKLKVIPSFEARYTQKNLDRSKLNFGDMIDPRRGIVWNTTSVIPKNIVYFTDLSSGILFQTRNSSFGISAFHISQPVDDLLGNSRLPISVNAHGSANLYIAQKYQITSFALLTRQEKYISFQLQSALIVKNRFRFGIGYKTGDVILTNFGFQTIYFTAFYGFDCAIAKHAGNSAGSHEAGLIFNFRKKLSPNGFMTLNSLNY